jgi:hypothetical protein
MSDESIYHLNLIVDNLTNSIRQVDNGESHETQISLVTVMDISSATKKNKWHFPWVTEFRKTDRVLYKLTKTDQPEILQGLISLSDMSDHVYVHLAESAPLNFGAQKLHEGVGGNLFAYACKRSWDNGNDGITAFQAKTRLINHYQQVLGAVHIGSGNMIIYPESALILIKQYFIN